MDTDNDQFDYLSVSSEFRSLVVVLCSFEVQGLEESELKNQTISSPATDETDEIFPLLLYKPFDPQAFRQIVRNFHL